MSTLLQEKAYLIDILGKDEVQTIPCALLFSDGDDVKFWVGPFAETQGFEQSAAEGQIYVIKFAIGASEIAYWSKKLPLIEAQWQRDDKWRDWISHSLSTQRKKWNV